MKIAFVQSGLRMRSQHRIREEFLACEVLYWGSMTHESHMSFIWIISVGVGVYLGSEWLARFKLRGADLPASGRADRYFWGSLLEKLSALHLHQG